MGIFDGVRATVSFVRLSNDLNRLNDWNVLNELYFCRLSQILNAHFCTSSCFVPMAGSASGKA